MTALKLGERPIRSVKDMIQSLAGKLGYKIIRNTGIVVQKEKRDPRSDMRKFGRRSNAPVILDVGANRGQSIKFFKSEFPDSIIHSFEASPTTFEELKKNSAMKNEVYLWNYALGAAKGKQQFFENTYAEMSSFFDLGELGWGKVKNKTWIDVETIDNFCSMYDIEYVDILKSDTQGFELQILHGAESMMDRNKIGLIYLEIIFSNMYYNLPPYYEIFEFLFKKKFHLIAFYDMYYQKNLASWTDALFAHETLINCD